MKHLRDLTEREKQLVAPEIERYRQVTLQAQEARQNLARMGMLMAGRDDVIFDVDKMALFEKPEKLPAEEG